MTVSAWTARRGPAAPRALRRPGRRRSARDDADGVAPQLVVSEGQIAGAGRRRPGPEGRHLRLLEPEFLSKENAHRADARGE